MALPKYTMAEAGVAYKIEYNERTTFMKELEFHAIRSSWIRCLQRHTGS
jgi:hypothetical protein